MEKIRQWPIEFGGRSPSALEGNTEVVDLGKLRANLEQLEGNQ